MKLFIITALMGGTILGIVAAVFYAAPAPVQTHPSADAQELPPRLQLRQDISALIEGLKDSDAADREICNRNLILLAGLSFDFKPSASLEERDAAVQRWR